MIKYNFFTVFNRIAHYDMKFEPFFIFNTIKPNSCRSCKCPKEYYAFQNSFGESSGGV